MNEAHNILTDPERRKEFLAEMELEKAGGKEKIEEMLEAEMLIPQAKAALRRRHYSKALAALQQIEAVLTDDAEVTADRVYCELMAALEAKADPKPLIPKLLQELQSTLSRRSDYAPAYYYRGMILKTEGREKEAAVDFQRALELDSGLAEASSQLRLMQMREEKKKKGIFGMS